MTTQQVLDLIGELGLKIVIRDGGPVLLGDKRLVTPSLRATLKWHRDRILAILAPKCEEKRKPFSGRTWLWRYGWTYTETPEDEWQWNHLERHPAGAWWVRLPGETKWRPIPGRCNSTPEELGLVECMA